MQIIVDTREQTPLKFILDDVVLSTVRETLDWGDYACRFKDESLCPIRFERKSLGDLFGSLTGGYKRLKASFERSKADSGGLFIIIEGTFTDVALGYKYSSQEPRSLLRRLFTIWLHHDIMPIFCSSPSEAAAYIKCFYEAFEKNMRHKEKLDGKADRNSDAVTA